MIVLKNFLSIPKYSALYSVLNYCTLVTSREKCHLTNVTKLDLIIQIYSLNCDSI